MLALAVGGSCSVARNLKSNYVFKPTAGSALRFDRRWTSRGGLTRRWISEAVACRWRASRDEVEALER